MSNATCRLPVLARIARAACSVFAGSRPTMVTRAPSAASSRAAAKPMPEVAPVTSAWRPPSQADTGFQRLRAAR